jgi:hypothetical protein
MSIEQRDRFTRMAQSFLTALAAEGMVLVPKNPSTSMLDSAVAFALNVKISRDYGWSKYMRDVYRAMLSAHQADEDSEGKNG